MGKDSCNDFGKSKIWFNFPCHFATQYLGGLCVGLLNQIRLLFQYSQIQLIFMNFFFLFFPANTELQSLAIFIILSLFFFIALSINCIRYDFLNEEYSKVARS